MARSVGHGEGAVRLDWGLNGATAERADLTVVVDVLSFSTAVTVAVGRGMGVVPCPWNDERAEQIAAAHDAVLAVGRAESAAQPEAPSLSPARLLACEAVPRVVLPSPNGSTIAAALVEGGSTVATGCLRNASAVARWLDGEMDADRTGAVVAAGERWPDGSLRVALEDHLGAGAILAALAARGRGSGLSPEAQAAATMFEVSRDRLAEHLRGCVSGSELVLAGFADDVEIAAALDSSDTVPILVEGVFAPADHAGSQVRPPGGPPSVTPDSRDV